MADDKIDIEEHDILDNPMLRRMFPDISVLKKEVFDFNDEVLMNEIPANNIVQEKTEKYPYGKNRVLSCFSTQPANQVIHAKLTENNFTKRNINKDYPTILIDEDDVILPYPSSGSADQVIEADFRDNNVTQIIENEKYPTIVIDEADVTLPHIPNDHANEVVDVNCKKNNSIQINQTEMYPTILIDETNVTLPDQITDANFTKSGFTKLSENKNNQRMEVDEALEVLSCYFSEVPDKPVYEESIKSNVTQINAAKKYFTKQNKTAKKLPHFPCKLSGKNIHESFKKLNSTQINDANYYPAKVNDDNNTNMPHFPNQSFHQIVYRKSTKNIHPQIDESNKYPPKVIYESKTNLPCFPSESTDKDFGKKYSVKNGIHHNNDSVPSKKIKIKEYAEYEKACPNIVKVKPSKQKMVCDSALLHAKNMNCNIDEETANRSNVKLNDSKMPKELQKADIVLPKLKIEQPLNQAINLPQQSSQSGNRIPLTDISSEKSNSNCTNNSELEQCRWKGNKIILGSKSSAMNSENKRSGKQNDLSSVRVLVENLGTFLSKSTRYCKNCFILFPSNKTLADHRDLIHSQLNSNQPSNSKRIVSNIKRSVNFKNKHKCNICGIVFASSSNLSRHKRCVHMLSMKIRKSKPNLTQNIQQKPEGKLNEDTNFRCTHCTKIFSSQQILIDHMYYVLQNKTNKDVIKSIEDVVLDKDKIDTNSLVYYRCPFCSYYFKQKYKYVIHLKNKHKAVDKSNLDKVVFDPVCKYCCNKYSNVKSFNVHIWNRHPQRLKLSRHLTKHIVEKARNTPKYKEQTQSKLNNDNNYTSKDDMDKVVAIKYKKISKTYLLKSVLFKCFKCNICFLSSGEAANHIAHENIATTWKCAKCLHIFKIEEQNSHVQQHLFCENFEVFEISHDTYLYLLFKCPNCVSYFREEDFFYHYSICEMQSPDSAYCKTCHILIDSNIKELHETYHKMEGGKEFNSILIEADVITYNDAADESIKESFDLHKSESEVKQSNYICHDDDIDDEITYNGHKENNLNESVTDSDVHIHKEEKSKRDIAKKEFSGNSITKTTLGKKIRFTYCSTCKAFIFVGKVRRLYNHIKGRCVNLTNYVCKYCGLVLSNKTIDSHRKLHQHVPNVTLSDFTFYDLRSGKRICPPVPKYPKCDLCDKHFIMKTSILSHVCSEDYLKCPLCNIKLSNSAFPLHMSFHKYSLKSKSEISLVDLSVRSKDSHPTCVSKLPNFIDSNKNSEDKYLFVYICKICKVSVDTYDRVIEHCHYHVSSQEKEILTQPCDSCNLIFDDTCFGNHKMLHSCCKNKKFSVLTYDAFYVTAEDKVWLNHLFGSLTKKEIGNILKNAIYNVERKIKMQIIQDGSLDLTYYKCAQCNSFVDPSSLYDHCKIGILCFKSKVVTCPICGISVSEEFLIIHEKIHETRHVTIRSYRIVLFNCDDDKSINDTLSMPRHYVLYECRNCNGIVDKKQFQYHKCDFEDLSKCSHCGLLLYNSDYMPHVIKHKEFCSFHENNIIVILLGVVKDVEFLTCRYKTSFRGIKLDYLFYKCNKCHICLKDKQGSLTHDCAEDLAKTKCVPCNLYFEDSVFKKHRKLHECDAYFLKENITILELDTRISRPSNVDVIVIEDEEDLHDISKEVDDIKLSNINSNEKSDSNETLVEKYDEIFRCRCGLHYLNETSALLHLTKCNNSRSSKQNCPKCGLLFKPNILYSHLLKHHASKQVSYKFNITPISNKK